MLSQEQSMRLRQLSVLGARIIREPGQLLNNQYIRALSNQYDEVEAHSIRLHRLLSGLLERAVTGMSHTLEL